MSTRVQPAEYTALRPVQHGNMGGCLCEATGVQHTATIGMHPIYNGKVHVATQLWATPDNRSIALCPGAVRSIQQRQTNAFALRNCVHEQLTEEGECRVCGKDCRGSIGS